MMPSQRQPSVERFLFFTEKQSGKHTIYLHLYSKNKNRIITNKIRSSRKRPRVKYWFYAGSGGSIATNPKEAQANILENTSDVISLIRNKNVIATSDLKFIDGDGSNDYNSWSAVFPQFLIWAVGK